MNKNLLLEISNKSGMSDRNDTQESFGNLQKVMFLVSSL